MTLRVSLSYNHGFVVGSYEGLCFIEENIVCNMIDGKTCYKEKATSIGRKNPYKRNNLRHPKTSNPYRYSITSTLLFYCSFPKVIIFGSHGLNQLVGRLVREHPVISMVSSRDEATL